MQRSTWSCRACKMGTQYFLEYFCIFVLFLYAQNSIRIFYTERVHRYKHTNTNKFRPHVIRHADGIFHQAFVQWIDEVDRERMKFFSRTNQIAMCQSDFEVLLRGSQDACTELWLSRCGLYSNVQCFEHSIRTSLSLPWIWTTALSVWPPVSVTPGVATSALYVRCTLWPHCHEKPTAHKDQHSIAGQNAASMPTPTNRRTSVIISGKEHGSATDTARAQVVWNSYVFVFSGNSSRNIKRSFFQLPFYSFSIDLKPFFLNVLCKFATAGKMQNPYVIGSIIWIRTNICRLDFTSNQNQIMFIIFYPNQTVSSPQAFKIIIAIPYAIYKNDNQKLVHMQFQFALAKNIVS